MGLKTLLRRFFPSTISRQCRPGGGEKARLLSDEDIAAGCLLITTEGQVARVAIKAHIVDDVALAVAALKCELPILLACKALGLSGEKIEKILANRGSHNIKTGNASKFHSTYHWGDEEIYFVQILSNYLKG